MIMDLQQYSDADLEGGGDLDFNLIFYRKTC